MSSASRQPLTRLLLFTCLAVSTASVVLTRVLPLPWSLILSLVAALACGLIIARWLAPMLTRLTEATQAIAQGRFDLPSSRAPVAEVDRLGQALTAMAQAMRDSLALLTSDHHQLSAILASMAEGVIAVDAQGRILLVNPAASVLLGASARGVRGQSLFDIIRHPEIQALARQVLQASRPSTKDCAVFQPTERVLRAQGVPCQGAGPGGPSAVLVIQDVTTHYRYDQLRKEFVANVSHELKSPLTAIRGLIETLLEGALEDPANNRRFVQLIEEDVARLARLIDDLLALSQIESQVGGLTLTRLQLKPLVESVVASLEASLRARRLTVTLEVPAELMVQADPDRLRQILVNLLDNAVKYNTDGGRILVRAGHEAQRVTVTVSDTGIGIPPEHLPRIFERFYRVDQARSRELGGTGLGLAIVKHLVEAHGGSVSVESQPGSGSAFCFTLPTDSR